MATCLPALLVVASVLLAGCSASGGGQAKPATPQRPSVTSLEVRSAKPVDRVNHAVSSLVQSYRRGDWGAVRKVVTSSALATRIIGNMRRWRAEGVPNFRIDVVATFRNGPGSSIATLRFTGDPRTVPVYTTLIFKTSGYQERIVGTSSGIRGASYRLANWHITRSKHFVVYHGPYSLAGSDRSVLRKLEFQRALFAKRFHVRLPPVTAYYLYPTVSMMRHMTGGGCGQSPDNPACTDPFASPPSMQVADLWPTYHEPIHVYQRAIEPRPPSPQSVYVAPLFIAEGMAVALEERNLDPRLSDYCSDLKYRPLDDCALPALFRVQPITILSDNGFHQVAPTDAYSLGGSFVKYLILKYGYRRFGRFYYVLAAQPKDRVVDYNVAAHRVYGQSIQTLLGKWRARLCAGACG